jgi:formate dehydrogenase maturation protein FdhE
MAAPSATPEAKHAYYEANKQKWTHWNWKRYGLSPEDWQTMYEDQEGRCAICGEMPTKRLVVDHDHETDQVRALLCSSCNVRLGSVEDRDFLSAATRYLNRF